MRTTIGLLALIAHVSAQGLSDLSSGCSSAATSLVASQFASCANLVGLVSLATNSGDLVPASASWINGLCSADPCSSDTLNSASETLSNGCSAEISDGNALITGANTIIEQYPLVRAMLCQQYTSNGTYCVPSVLGSVQSSSGDQITLNNLIDLLSDNGLSGIISDSDADAVCTDCGKALVVTGAELEQATSSGSSSLTSAASDKCGASFAEGQIPSSVQQANGAASSSPGSATARPTNDSAAIGLTPGLGAMLAVVATTSGLLLGAMRVMV